jgi:single-stranded-DNA-specific exonuclease
MKLPVFLYRKGDKTSRGAVRMPQGFNAVDLMSQSSDILIEYGGHPPAAGFKILNENLIEFEQRLKDYFKK